MSSVFLLEALIVRNAQSIQFVSVAFNVPFLQRLIVAAS